MDTRTGLELERAICHPESLLRSTRRSRKSALRRVSRLRVERKRREDIITLRWMGKRGKVTRVAVNRLRSAAFLAIGELPPEIRLDLSEIHGPLEIEGAETLITIARVASMMNVKVCIAGSVELERFCQRIGLGRLVAESAQTVAAGALSWSR